jgi:SAM-dependent methyltransferase
MNVERETLIDYFSDKLGIDPDVLSNYLTKSSDEYYNMEYFLNLAYYWYSISYDLIKGLFLSYIPAKVETAVDIGCGPGLYKQLVLERAEKYVGVDISRSVIDLSGDIYAGDPRSSFLLGDAASIEIEKDSVDLIFCSEVIEHIEDNHMLFGNFHRILKHNGRIFLTTTTFYYYFFTLLSFFVYQDIYKNKDFRKFIRRFKLYFNGFKGPAERTRFMREGLDRNDHVHAFTLSQLKQICDESGFEILRYDYFNCKNVFQWPGRLFVPANWTLKKLFRTSKIYGPNIALLLGPK